MAKGPEIPKTDSAEIEILIERLKQNRLEQRDVELIELLLRTVMALVNLLQRKNMSIKRLRDLIFGRRTEKRKTGSVSQPEDKPCPFGRMASALVKPVLTPFCRRDTTDRSEQGVSRHSQTAAGRCAGQAEDATG